MSVGRFSLLGLVAAALIGVAAAHTATLVLAAAVPRMGILVMLVLIAQLWVAVRAASRRTVPQLAGVALLAVISAVGPVSQAAAPLMLAAAFAAGAAGQEYLQERRARASR
ncbi:MAG: hypothetical protein O2822_00840 [Chloroflexi bacterium]|nr:hypothetical protein [Chloroflexota bacterium]